MVQIEFIGSHALSEKSSKQKINMIIGIVKRNRIAVLEEALSSQEEKMLIEETMENVGKSFSGIEVATLGKSGVSQLQHALIKALGGRPSGLTVVGPSHLVREVKRDPGKLQLSAGKR
ncbi:MAG TPA: DUF2073 domain-containing protein [Candidatus Norongarragalinales archaeon]|jgi:hypothetical protein|nr:DUF2073 domain-containing protein [Candidatus Norongarragalinales archaeon]